VKPQRLGVGGFIFRRFEVSMNKTRFGLVSVCLGLFFTCASVQAQFSVQRLTFSLLGEYETNTFSTNTSDPSQPLTNQFSQIKTVLIATPNVIKALAVDIAGTNFTNWTGGSLVRVVSLTNGAEGIYLRANGNQTNVSSFFNGTDSNDFTATILTNFPGLTNNISGLTNNFINGSTNNSNPMFEVDRGARRMTDATNIITNFSRLGGLYFISLNTTNLKFNVIGVGDGVVTNVTGSIAGTPYALTNSSAYLGTAGYFYLNVVTNLFDAGSNAPIYFTGPMRGTISIGVPFFSVTGVP
jgi:hypothetical protein